ncbi:hypothetical protein HHK36_030056 [Tetracentron sinense]|uniref:Uncharacterized protein n=1 Tax=Tetracentron sinense TaxID=13715 RepID=A0A834YF13_TETSI|nr:hypothetical protein HHK36_030056 [Tetracentron sinense]
MGRSPCCENLGLKKGPWTPGEDQKLLAYIEEFGHGSWRALPAKAGLKRCGKSCRLRWTNYLRPDIKRGKFTSQEEQTIIQLHALLGNRTVNGFLNLQLISCDLRLSVALLCSLSLSLSLFTGLNCGCLLLSRYHFFLRWSAIATHLPKRTDNEIKNFWNTHLKKRLAKMGIDPVTHKPKSDTLSVVDGQSKYEANLSHMAQWESARLEAEARLVKESKSRWNSFQNDQLSPSESAQLLNKWVAPPAPPLSLDILNAWQGFSSKPSKGGVISGTGYGHDLASPTSTLTFSENVLPIPLTVGIGKNSSTCDDENVKEENEEEDWRSCKERMENSITFTTGFHDMAFSMEGSWTPESLTTGNGHVPVLDLMEGFTDLLLDNSNNHSSSYSGRDSDNAGGCSGRDDYEENKNYWNNILNLVNSSPTGSPFF